MKATDGEWYQASGEDVEDSFFNNWHEISAVYDSTNHTLTAYIDGVVTSEPVEVNGSVSVNEALTPSIGYMADKPNRKSEMGFSNVKVLSEALSADELKALSAGTSDADDENVVLWLDFAADEIADARTSLNAQLDAAKDLVEDEYTAESWNAFESAKAAADAINPTYATADNVNKAAADLNAAIKALVKDETPEPVEVDTTLLEAACNKAKALNLAEFSETGKDAFNTAKAAAEAELSAKTSQEAVNAKASALNNAMLALRKTPSADKLPQ